MLMARPARDPKPEIPYSIRSRLTRLHAMAATQVTILALPERAAEHGAEIEWLAYCRVTIEEIEEICRGIEL